MTANLQTGFTVKQADALLIESRAKARLADEYDAAQERGEVAGHGGGRNFKVADSNVEATTADLGLRRDEIHEGRQIRDFEDQNPGGMSARLAMKATYHAIDADSDHVWPEVSAMWSRCLSPDVRAKLALTALDACEDDHAQNIAQHVLGVSGASVAPFLSHMDEAAFWADLASGDELAAYCLASFNRMSPHRQADFLSLVQGRAAA